MAIRSIRHKGLCRLWESGDAKGVPPDSAAKLRRMLAALHRSSIARLEDGDAHDLDLLDCHQEPRRCPRTA